MPIIDAQLHEPALSLDWGQVDRDVRFQMMLEVELGYMDAVGVDKAILFPIETEWGAWAAERLPDRFAVVPMITPPGWSAGSRPVPDCATSSRGAAPRRASLPCG